MSPGASRGRIVPLTCKCLSLSVVLHCLRLWWWVRTTRITSMCQDSEILSLKSCTQRGVKNVIFIGDTNQENGDSMDVARALGMPMAHSIRSSPLFVSCCHKVNDGFVWKFDRIITNFGRMTDAGVFEVPSWAAPSMHRAVHAKIQLS